MFWMVLLALVIVAAFAALAYPFMRAQGPWQEGGADAALTHLRREKNRVLRTLKDLEVERESGALATRDFDRLRAVFLAEAAEINRRLDALHEQRHGEEGRERAAGEAAASRTQSSEARGGKR